MQMMFNLNVFVYLPNAHPFKPTRAWSSIGSSVVGPPFNKSVCKDQISDEEDGDASSAIYALN